MLNQKILKFQHSMFLKVQVFIPQNLQFRMYYMISKVVAKFNKPLRYNKLIYNSKLYHNNKSFNLKFKWVQNNQNLIFSHILNIKLKRNKNLNRTIKNLTPKKKIHQNIIKKLALFNNRSKIFNLRNNIITINNQKKNMG